MSDKKSDTGRSRNFATVVYPESASPGWDQIISDSKIPALISPLHDLDINPDGELKKAHYHVILMFDGVKTLDQVREFIQSFGGVGVERIASIRGYVRYLCHLDNPEKHQYDTSLVRAFSGADFSELTTLASDVYQCIKDMQHWCIDNDVFAYCDLLEYAADNKYDWYRVLCDRATVVMVTWLKSRSWKMRRDDHA